MQHLKLLGCDQPEAFVGAIAMEEFRGVVECVRRVDLVLIQAEIPESPGALDPGSPLPTLGVPVHPDVSRRVDTEYTAGTAQHVLAVGYNLQVRWVDAGRVSAKVIEKLAASVASWCNHERRIGEELEDDPVGAHHLPIPPDPP